MSGFLAIAVAAYFIWKANEALEEDDYFKATMKLCAGFFVVFVLGSIFL